MIEFEDFNFGDVLDDNFSIVTEEIDLSEKESDKKNHKSQKEFPLLPVRNMVMFPKVMIPITAGREQSKLLLEEAYKNGAQIGIISQKNSTIENPSQDDLFTVGTIARVIKIIKLPDGNITAITRGTERFKIKNVIEENPYFKAQITRLKDTQPADLEQFEALLENIKDLALKIIQLDPNIPNAANFAINNLGDNEELLNFICTNASFPSNEKQALLEEKSIQKRAEKTYEFLLGNFRKLELRNQIHQKTNKELDKNQREYYLNQQMRTIQEELGGGQDSDVEELLEKAKTKHWNAVTIWISLPIYLGKPSQKMFSTLTRFKN